MNCEKFSVFEMNGRALERKGLIFECVTVKAPPGACPTMLSWCLCECLTGDQLLVFRLVEPSVVCSRVADLFTARGGS